MAAGHICLDITPVFPADKTGKPEELLLPGKLLRMDGVDVHTGGSVANTGLGMAFFGADTALMGKIGDDAFGKLILEILAQHGCSREGMIVVPDAVTSYSVVLALPGQDRIFLHAPGANDTFTCEDVNYDVVGEADLFHFGYPPLMREMYKNDGAQMVEMFRRVKGMGLATSLDMAAVDPASDAGKANWRRILTNLIPYVDFFLPSAEELCFMLDRPRWEEWMARTDGDVTETLDIERDVKPLAEELLRMGSRVVVIKCGARGLYYRTAEEADLGQIGRKAGLCAADWAGQEGFQRSFPPEKICSATGAGDTCIAAFLTAMLEGRAMEECIRLAAAAGASCVEAYDALSGLKPFAVLEEKIANGWGR